MSVPDSVVQVDLKDVLAAGSDPLTNYIHVEPTSSTIVNQKRHTIYYRAGDEALYGTAITYLVSVDNEKLMSWSNGTDRDQTYSQTYTTDFKSTTSTEVSTSLSLGPSFEGVSIGSVDIGVKTFDSQETSTESSHTTVTVGAQSDLYFYQRKYNLQTEVYFTLDAWNDFWIAGSNGGYHVQIATINSTISTRDYVTRTQALTGSARLRFDGQSREGWFGNYVRKFENLTSRAKSTLRSMGIDGSQQG
ncbi:hypothetical protein K435DRAFT_923915 [Dendrothele bispora CBS 962.96]|uniref:Uncharacterized protein n=1 Tax=Dendrothele bispora (strain CBS 962.96) TaxID=1314807 RepID=A0A4S8MII0_DENBC|nr:hypothetical protein K435DRAFT_923915 [Dendrothele bispora CBS 962.96]